VVRVGLVCTMLLSLFAIIGTYSRGALLGLGAVTVLLAWRSSHRVAMLFAVGVSVAVAISFMPTTWVNRMATLETYQEDESAQAHLSSWQIATAFALARPLTGAGFMGSYTADVVDQFDPGQVPRAVHSIYLEVLGENGFPAFFVWLGISLVGIANTRRIMRQTRGMREFEWARDLAKMAQVSIVAYLVAGAFLPFSYWDFYFTMLVAVAATRERVTEELGQIRHQPVPFDPLQERLTATVAARALQIRQRRPADG
jgi:putative inorganic carbon (HCO3(-)) transporter